MIDSAMLVAQIARNVFCACKNPRLQTRFRFQGVSYLVCMNCRMCARPRPIVGADAPEFDFKTCITAYELRQHAIAVPATVPDCAWVPRASISFVAGKTTCDAECRMSISVGVTFSQPFRWVEVKGKIG